MILKYVNKNGKEVVKTISMIRVGFSSIEYQLINGQVVEVDDIHRCWIGEK